MSFSNEEIASFAKNPVIFDVSRDQITLTLSFRQKIYDAWMKDPVPNTVRQILRENGIDPDKLPRLFYRNITYSFKRNGKPKNELSLKGSLKRAFRSGPGSGPQLTEDDLVATGKFIWKERGIDFSPAFASELYTAYPETPLPDAIRGAGIDPDLVGNALIRRLEMQFKRMAGAGIKSYSGKALRQSLPVEELHELKRNPYVKVIPAGKIKLSERFYESAASLASLPIDEILGIYFIREDSLSIKEKTRASERLKEATPSAGKTETAGTVNS